MDAKDHLVNAVLNESRRYMVPLYQRQFQWREQRLRPFWADVVAKAEELMDGRPHYPHYMGALILAPGGDGYAIGVTPRMQVVDGQQRLTTFQVLIAAIAETSRARGWNDMMAKAQNYLFNATKAADTDPHAKFKLSPTPADRSLFHDIVLLTRDELRARYPDFFFQNGNLKRGGASPALLAYEFFMDSVERYLEYGAADEDELRGQDAEAAGSDIQQNRLEALLQGLLSSMKLVVITLDDNDDAQVIFETLNSQGQPLLAMDLVRNNIFHRAEAQGESSESLYHSLWESFDDAWWRESAPRARPRLPRIDHFLAHVLTAETGQAVSMRELYAEYRGYTRPKGKARFERVQHELELLTGYAPAYEVLEGRSSGDPEISRLGRRLAAWEMISAYPVGLLVAQSAVDAAERAHIARLLYSYIVRRGVCGLSTKSINAAFQRIAGALKTGGVTAQSFLSVFDGQTREAIRFPDDTEFTAALRSRPLYQTLGASRLQDLLWELELASRTAMTEKLPKPSELSIEHVLPQRWGAGWPFEDGVVSSFDEGNERAVARNHVLNTIGNLTLVTGSLNSSLGNGDFAAKKSKLEQHSLLALNKPILARTGWAEQEIEQRAYSLSTLAVAIWPRE